MIRDQWKPGDWAVYRMHKRSTSPGRRAKHVHPAQSGDSYSYAVDKFWVVEEVIADGSTQLRTRRGKKRTIANDDPNLRRPKWWERWLFASRFSAVANEIGD